MHLAMLILSHNSYHVVASPRPPNAFVSILRQRRPQPYLSDSCRWLVETHSSASPSQNRCKKKDRTPLRPRHYSLSYAYRGGASLSSSSSPLWSTRNDNTQSNSNDDLPQGRTGWNHNLPSEKSDFWDETSENNLYARKDNNIAADSSRRDPSEDAQADDDSNNERNAPTPAPAAARTGWLHNVEPTPQAKAMSVQEQEKTSKARLMLQQAMKERDQNHRMIAPPTFHACGGEGRCLVVTEHLIALPLYRDVPRSPRIDVFFSIVERATDENTVWLQDLASLTANQRAKTYVQRSGLTNADDMILYLQGGPGFGSPTPMVSLGFSPESSWAASALDQYNRVVLMDQRGTGR